MSRRLKGRLAPAGWVWGAMGLLAVVAVMEWQGRRAGPTAIEDAAEVVEVLFAEGRSGVDITIQGMIDRVLADDNRGSRHQRFIVRLSTGATLLIAHNIDLAERAPVEVGDLIRVRGEYEWNEQGGVVHWTHHDPAGRRPGGWLEHDGGPVPVGCRTVAARSPVSEIRSRELHNVRTTPLIADWPGNKMADETP